MSRKIYLPILVAGVAVVFALVCLGVVISNSRDSWIRRKLKIGALLLSLTGSATGCGPSPIVCYLPSPYFRDEVLIGTATYGDDGVYSLTVSPGAGFTIAAILYGRLGNAYSFVLVDGGDQIVQSGDLGAEDGDFDEENESLNVFINPDLSPGVYTLQFYAQPISLVTDLSQFLMNPYRITVAP